MSIRDPLGSATRRCETNVVAIDGACLTCGVAIDEPCGLRIPEERRAAMTRRQRLAQAERLDLQATTDWLRSWVLG